MTPTDIEMMFTRTNGDYAFARWGRPIAPIVFGVDDATLEVVKGAIEAVTQLAGIGVMETDAELGANFMMFFLRDWDELLDVRDLGEMIPDLAVLVGRLKMVDANQYRLFRFDDAGAIKACFVFLRMDDAMNAVAADTLALSQVIQAILLWSQDAFKNESPLVNAPDGGASVVRQDIVGIIHAAYLPTMPVAASDNSHALRLFARI